MSVVSLAFVSAIAPIVTAAISFSIPILIDADNAQIAQSQVGTHFMGWFSFQPLYDKIVREEPDLLE